MHILAKGRGSPTTARVGSKPTGVERTGRSIKRTTMQTLNPVSRTSQAVTGCFYKLLKSDDGSVTAVQVAKHLKEHGLKSSMNDEPGCAESKDHRAWTFYVRATDGTSATTKCRISDFKSIGARITIGGKVIPKGEDDSSVQVTLSDGAIFGQASENCGKAEFGSLSDILTLATMKPSTSDEKVHSIKVELKPPKAKNGASKDSVPYTFFGRLVQKTEGSDFGLYTYDVVSPSEASGEPRGQLNEELLSQSDFQQLPE